MKNDIQENIKFKIAISLNKLLSRNKQCSYSKDVADYRINSYNKIALNADIRKATVSDIFNAKTNTSTLTLFSIIEAMGYTLSDFALIYDAIEEPEIEKFSNESSSKK